MQTKNTPRRKNKTFDLVSGFDYWLVAVPWKINALQNALRDFWTWQKATKTCINKDGIDLLEITKMLVFKSIDDVVCYREALQGLWWIEEDRFTVGDLLSSSWLDFYEVQQERKWVAYWVNIAFTDKWPEKVWAPLIYACRKHGCDWFVGKFIEDDLTKMKDLSMEILREAFPNAKFQTNLEGWGS